MPESPELDADLSALEAALDDGDVRSLEATAEPLKAHLELLAAAPVTLNGITMPGLYVDCEP